MMSKEARLFWTIASPIIHGTLQTNDVLPSYSQLANYFDVSINTISRTAFALRMCGFVYGKQGEGMYVSNLWETSWEDRSILPTNVLDTTLVEDFLDLVGTAGGNQTTPHTRLTRTEQ